jgi:hypothetical protein
LAGPRVLRLVTAASLGRALRDFGHVRLVLAGPPPVPSRAWSRLAGRADEVTSAAPGPTAPGVTPVGPAELPLSARPRQLAAGLGRRLVGPRAAAGIRRRLRV